MIKVNLLRNKVGDTQINPGATSMAAVQNVEVREALVKIVFLGMFTLGLMFYESQNIRSLQADLQRLQVQAQDLDKQVRRLQSMPGIGFLSAVTLAVRLPELGRLTRHAIACLIGRNVCAGRASVTLVRQQHSVSTG